MTVFLHKCFCADKCAMLFFYHFKNSSVTDWKTSCFSFIQWDARSFFPMCKPHWLHACFTVLFLFVSIKPLQYEEQNTKWGEEYQRHHGNCIQYDFHYSFFFVCFHKYSLPFKVLFTSFICLRSNYKMRNITVNELQLLCWSFTYVYMIWNFLSHPHDLLSSSKTKRDKSLEKVNNIAFP